jgi:DUF2894 family protein
VAESGKSGVPVAPPPPDVDPGVPIDALRARSADRFDPVGFRFIEALARRATAHRDDARRMLDRRLAKALIEFGERFDRAEREARDALASGTARFPEAADALRQHCDAGDFGGLHRLLAKLEASQGGGGPLAELLAHIGRDTPEAPTGGPAHADGAVIEPQGELKSLRYFRSTWSRLSVDRQLSHAFAQAPENAGPLNSHFLVLQSLGLMRDISPEYLEQFMSYVDALLWLDQAADSGRSPAQKNAARGHGGRKRKSGRGNAG